MSTQIRDVLEGLSTEAYDPPATALNGPKTDQLPTNLGRTAPKDIVVDPMHRGDYITITEAIEAANPGDKILVRPGLYQEGLVIDKPLEIVGEGERSEIEVRATGKPALVFKTTNGRVANLTLRHTSGKGLSSCINISQGRLTLEDCDISSQDIGCVSIHHGADPRIRRNKIHGGLFGISINKDGQGTIEENDIFGNTNCGVEISFGGNSTLRKNRIYDGKGAGVCVYLNGQGIIDDNDIFGNSCAGVLITSGWNVTVRSNRINGNGYEAIWIEDDGSGVFEDNDLRNNKRDAWNISKASKSIVKRARNLE